MVMSVPAAKKVKVVHSRHKWTYYRPLLVAIENFRCRKLGKHESVPQLRYMSESPCTLIWVLLYI